MSLRKWSKRQVDLIKILIFDSRKHFNTIDENF